MNSNPNDKNNEGVDTSIIINEIRQFLAPYNPHVLGRYLKIRHLIQESFDGWPEFQIPKNQIEMCILWLLDQAAITLTNHLIEKVLKSILIQHNTNYNVDEKNILLKMQKGSEAAIAKYDRMELSQTINCACSQGLITKDDKKKLHKLRMTLRNPYSHAEQTSIHGDVKAPFIAAMVDSNLNIEFQEKCELPISAIVPISGIAVQPHAEVNSIPYFEYVVGFIKRTLPKITPTD